MSNRKFSIVIYILYSILVLVLSIFIFRIIIYKPYVKADDKLSLENEIVGAFSTKSPFNWLDVSQ
jgi:tellurite resistance protein TehA-like permease